MSEVQIFKPIYEEIKRRIEREFGEKLEVKTEYPRSKEIKKLPVCFVEMTDISPGTDPGTGQVELNTRWEIRVLLSAKQENVKVAVRDVSARIGAMFHSKVLAPFAFPAKYLGSSDDHFDFKVKDIESWVSELQIVIRVGENNWGKWEFFPENLEWDKYLDEEFARDNTTYHNQKHESSYFKNSWQKEGN
ncbi:MAG: hypothetical protein AB8G05_27455 [Oligoflexales bacterium]